MNNLSKLAFGSLIFSFRNTPLTERKKILEYLFDNNINTIDTAVSYSNDDNHFGQNEQTLTETLEEIYKEGKYSKEELLITTKGGTYRKDGKYLPKNNTDFLIESCKESLKNLKLDTIPLYYLHALDRVTEIKEIATTLDTLKKEAKILKLGLSNVEIFEAIEFQKTTEIFAIQNKLNPYYQKDFKTGMLDFCKDYKIKYYAYGVFRNINLEYTDNVNILLKKLALKYQTTPQIIALLWLKSKGEHVIPIISSTNLEHLAQIVKAFASLDLEKKDTDLIDAL